jgi:hypothetical protein
VAALPEGALPEAGLLGAALRAAALQVALPEEAALQVVQVAALPEAVQVVALRVAARAAAQRAAPVAREAGVAFVRPPIHPSPRARATGRLPHCRWEISFIASTIEPFASYRFCKRPTGRSTITT